MKLRLVLSVMVVMVACCTNSATDWAHFLGPKRNSTASETGLLRSLPKFGPEVLWTVAIGKGYGGPVVKNANVYLIKPEFHQGFSSSPILAGDRIYLTGLSGKTHIFKAARQFESLGSGDIGEPVYAPPLLSSVRGFIFGDLHSSSVLGEARNLVSDQAK